MSILFLLLSLTLAGILAGVLVSYSYVWTTRACRDPALMEGRFRPEALLLALRLVVFETGSLLATLLLHPLGWLGDLGHPSDSRGSEGQSTPVLLLHGLFHNRGCWWWIRRSLRRRGLTRVYTLNLPLWRDAEEAVRQLSRMVDQILRFEGADRVQLVGHSMGGIVARKYLQQEEGASGKVALCLLLGTPNRGSFLAPLAISPLGKTLVPGSPFLQDLNERPLPQQVRFAAIYSRHDNLVIPYDSGRMEGGRSIEIAGMGHCSLLYHRETVETLIAILTQERR